MSLFDKATDGITHLMDGDKDGSAIDDVFKFAAGGVTSLLGDVAGLIPGDGGKVAGNLMKTISSPLTAGAEDYGDMLSDFFGSRGKISSDTTDEDYKQVFKTQGENGQFDGFGTGLRKELGAGSQGGALGGGLLGAGIGAGFGPMGALVGGMAGAGLGAVAPNLLAKLVGPNAPAPTAPQPRAPMPTPMPSPWGGLVDPKPAPGNDFYER